MSKRIERHTIEPACRVVAKLIGHETVGGLMGGDRDDRRHRKCGDVQRIIERDVHVLREASGGKKSFDAAACGCEIKIGIVVRQRQSSLQPCESRLGKPRR